MSAALRLLTGRDRSEAELANRLKRKGFSAENIEKTVQRCRELGYLDDARYARQRARMLTGSGRAVGHRLLNELKSRGIDETTAREAIDDTLSELDQDKILIDLLERRFVGFDYRAADDRMKKRVVNYCLRRGFPLSRVLAILKEER